MSLSLGPVSEVLERELRKKVVRHGVVTWLDADRRYAAFVGALSAARQAGALPYEVRAFSGSFLELMLELAPLSSGTDAGPLVVYLPGFNTESVKETPMLELYKTGTMFQKGLETLVTEAAAGKVAPEHIEERIAGAELTLDDADAWLARALEAPAGGFAALVSGMSVPALFDDLLHQRGAVRQAGSDGLLAHFTAALGLPRDWAARALGAAAPALSDVAFAAASWALSVEYVHDLTRPPTVERLASASALPAAVIAACRELSTHLRASHRDFYEQTARQTQELLLQAEAEAARAADLGKIDTFPFEDEVVLEEALEALREGAFDAALGWARQRIDGRSFWLERRPARMSEWQLVRGAAALGAAIEAASSALSAKSLDEAAARYASAGAAVDRAHRHLEQQRHALLYSQLDRFEELRPLLDAMRERWRIWADGWARDFNALCKKEGFLPSGPLLQRGLFEEVVRPLAAQGTTAFFLVDALRYEMGEELLSAIASPATEAKIAPRFAELPTNTEVGMNVLAPVAGPNGRLAPAIAGGRIAGFSCGEFRVSSPETRKRAMQDRIGGATAPWLTLQDVLDRSAASLKASVSKASLVVVHSQELDKAGESDFGPKIFDQLLGHVRTAWRRLREAGVKHFVITADHGFLLLHDRAEHAQPHGRAIDPRRRHVLSEHGADHKGEVRVALADLGYDGGDGLHLMFPETTAAFDTGKRGGDFVHGGNSLQERVIPVITLAHRAAAGGSSLRYRALARPQDGIAGMHCLEIEVQVAAQEALAFARDAEVELALRADLPDVDVDIVQARRGGRVAGSSLYAPVGKPIEVFFRLHGRTDARAQLEVFHPSAAVELEACVVARRFDVTASGTKPPMPASGADAPEREPASAAEPSAAWLESLPEGVRAIFAHLSAHGTVSEAEATAMLGGARALRRFSAKFEEYAGLAPFAVRIENVAGVKTYVRDEVRG